MKTLLVVIVLALSLSFAFAQTESAHEWKVTLKVVDDAGQAVAGAETSVNYLTNRFIGFTDTNGIFTASHLDHSVQLSLQAHKPGYYSFAMQYLLGFRYDPATWNPTVQLVLQRITKPIPMYARRAQIQIPAVDKPIGFDLVEYDWIAPYGNGKHSDIVFSAHRRWVSRNDFNATLKIMFSNPGDGVLIAPNQPKPSSGPRILAPAPVDGYIPEDLREIGNTPSEGWKDSAKDQNCYFRIRTTRDENGIVNSALYGKMYGDFGLDPINSKTLWILFTYYLNPTSNSRDIEFDPNQNLFKDLPEMLQVKDP